MRWCSARRRRRRGCSIAMSAVESLIGRQACMMVQRDWGKAANSISCALMRQVSGFERAGVQWMFVALGIVLVVVAAGEAVALRRSRVADRESAGRRVECAGRAGSVADRGVARAGRARVVFARTRAGAWSRPSSHAADADTFAADETWRTASGSDGRQAGGQPDDSTSTRLASDRETPPAPRYTIVLRTWTEGETIWSRGGLSISTVENTRMVTTLISGDVFAAGRLRDCVDE